METNYQNHISKKIGDIIFNYWTNEKGRNKTLVYLLGIDSQTAFYIGNTKCGRYFYVAPGLLRGYR
jgi:hypothetical protein